MRPLLLALVLLASGCIGAPPAPPSQPPAPSVDVEERGTPTSPSPEGEAGHELDVHTFALTWSDPSDGRGHEMAWDVVRAWHAAGRVTIETTTRGIEGGDFRFTMSYTAADPPARVYFHEEHGASAGTFDFAYTEAVFWSGEPVTRVVSVDPRSWVRVEAQDVEDRTLRGTFLLDFVGVCDEPDCGDYADVPRHRVLEGRFGP